MPSIGGTREQFLAELDSLSEDEVRIKVKTGLYSNVNEKRALAEEWLYRKELARNAEAESRRASSQSEQIAIARSAKDAAWAAATAARDAALIAKKQVKRAMIANVIAAIAAGAAIVAAVITYLKN